MTSLPELHGGWCQTDAASWSVVAVMEAPTQGGSAVSRAGAGSLASVGCAMGSVGNMAKRFGRSMNRGEAVLDLSSCQELPPQTTQSVSWSRGRAEDGV